MVTLWHTIGEILNIHEIRFIHLMWCIRKNQCLFFSSISSLFSTFPSHLSAKLIFSIEEDLLQSCGSSFRSPQTRRSAHKQFTSTHYLPSTSQRTNNQIFTRNTGNKRTYINDSGNSQECQSFHFHICSVN